MESHAFTLNPQFWKQVNWPVPAHKVTASFAHIGNTSGNSSHCFVLQTEDGSWYYAHIANHAVAENPAWAQQGACLNNLPDLKLLLISPQQAAFSPYTGYLLDEEGVTQVARHKARTPEQMREVEAA